ncbi:hypothetical protein PILCRDRAFT_13057 [Piloderma croceum F 1598]|uniref:Ribonucleotide reductase large subunit C-terminal domain-containing protein n=1 Tax=Piloderma croceum (strain F 1598) TaxID=765440 RepID=A0A0C3EUG9_PILCF|nr:hypothetical protein PILCRDRAFT_13057 [Piloderma croceum F 1598]
MNVSNLIPGANIYMCCVLAGEFQVVCPWLLRKLVDLGLWNDQMKNMIIAHSGSVQNIPGIPDNVKAIYKTIQEIFQKKAPTLGQLTSMHFYGWKKGLKMGMYYLRTRPTAQAIQFMVDQSVLKDVKMANTKAASAVVEKNRASRGGVTGPLPLPLPSPV